MSLWCGEDWGARDKAVFVVAATTAMHGVILWGSCAFFWWLDASSTFHTHRLPRIQSADPQVA